MTRSEARKKIAESLRTHNAVAGSYEAAADKVLEVLNDCLKLDPEIGNLEGSAHGFARVQQ